MKLVFWLLDINPKVDGDKVELWLWGIDATGNRVLLVERNFTAYFYAVLHGGADGAAVAEAIMRQLRFQCSQSRSCFPTLLWQTRNRNQSQLQRCNPNQQSRHAKYANIDGVSDCYEDDIRAAMRYLIDNDVVPCSWHEVDATEDRKHPRC